MTWGGVDTPDTSDWRCKKCGCTEKVPCKCGCWWVGPQLCSTCATPEQLYIHAMAGRLKQVHKLFLGVFKLPKEMQVHVKGREDMKEQSQRRALYGRSKYVSVPSDTGHYKTHRKLEERIDLDKLVNLIPKGGWRKLNELIYITGRSASTINNILKKLIKAKRLKVKTGTRKKGERGSPPKIYGRSK